MGCQLQRLDVVVKERNRLLQQYRKLVDHMPLKFLEIPEDVISALHLAVIRLDNCCNSRHRQIFEGLRAHGIGVQLHYMPVHLQPYYRRLDFKEGDYPNAEAYANDAISLPLYPGLQDADQQRVVNALASLLST